VTAPNGGAADDPAARQQRSTAVAWRSGGLTVEDLWTRYFAVGGEAGLLEVDAYLNGLAGLPALQRDMLAHAANEHLDELTSTHRALYSRPFRESRPRSQPLAALVELLEGTMLAPPDRLPALAAAAAGALGVRLTIYLVDYAERRLYPVPVADGDTGPARQPLDVDVTLAGQAYRQVQILPSESRGRARLWVPLMDGVERLGVLDIEVTDPADVYDPGLRTQCRWLSMLLGHLVTLASRYGDALENIRLGGTRTPAGELIWSLLPPLTAGVDNFVVSGAVEPRLAVGGDAFDYALSESTASLIMIDAVGHDPRSGLVAATALAAYRSARRAGHGLFEQARAIDEAIDRQLPGAAFATAVLAEVDLPTGRLRYLNAGHPQPLIMRDGKVVKPLTGGGRPPLGLGPSELTIAEEALQPDDWLVLYTDGITEARSGTGEWFGLHRLVDFLRREAAAGHPPPETARRLVQAVLDHQQGALQDDATILLARWTQARQIGGWPAHQRSGADVPA
jgi:GAF domain-containing protein